MIDATTHRPIRVSNDGTAGPYIIVPMSQLADVQHVLDQNQVRYWVDEQAISIDGKPEITVVNLGHRCDPERVQKLLDNAT